MVFTRETVTEADLALVAEAIEAVTRADDRSFLEGDLIAEISKRISGGTPKDRERRARALMEAHNRQGGMTLLIPGVSPKPEIPPEVDTEILTALLDLHERGMDFEDINTMLHAHFPDVDPRDVLDIWKVALEQINWEIESNKALYDLFETWDRTQEKKGRPAEDRVFGNFIRETGLLATGVRQ